MGGVGILFYKSVYLMFQIKMCSGTAFTAKIHDFI